MEYLVGSTGFVGSNLKRQHKFDGVFHSTDIVDAYGKEPELLVYAGVRAEMFLANQDPAADRELIGEAINNIERIRPKACVLISTIAVYPEPVGVDEDAEIDSTLLSAYGANRLYLEKWVESNIEDYLIVRLPAIYGLGIKKNFLYDYIHRIPSMLTVKKMMELSEKAPELKNYYLSEENGYFRIKPYSAYNEPFLKEIFQYLGFSALNFTDSRSVYQFYNLANLWGHIEIARNNGIEKLNVVTAPLSVKTLYRRLTGEIFTNELNKNPYNYDIRSKHYALFNGENGYLIGSEKEMEDIVAFVKACGGDCL